jgi:CHAT domain-containing protein
MRSRFGFTMLIIAVLASACADAPASPAAAPDADSLLAPGREFYQRAAYDSAQLLWSEALARARANGDSLSSAHLLTWLGLAAWRSGDYAAARAHGERALELKLALDEDAELSRSYNALGLLALAEDRLLDGLHLFELARAAAQDVDDVRAVGAAEGNMGLIHAYLGDLERAAVLLEQMLEAGAALGDEGLQANALTNLAMVSIWSGDPQGALAPLDEALRIYRALGSPFGEQVALDQRASALATMGHYEEAFATLDSALLLAGRHGLTENEAHNHRLLGTLFGDLGDPRRAVYHFEQAAELARALGLDSELGNVLRSAALVHLELGAEARALEDAQAALAVHRAAGERMEELADLLVLADLQQRSGAYSAAEGTLGEARLIALEVDSRAAVSAVALAEARLSGGRGAWEEVLAAVEGERAVGLEADFRTRAEGHSLASRAHAALGRLDRAAEEGLAAVRALERVRGQLGSRDLRSSFAASSAEIYGDLVLILIQLERVEEAFAVADASRSRELLQRLSAARSSPQTGQVARATTAASPEFGAAEFLLRRIDALLSNLNELEGVPPDQRGLGTEVTSQEILTRIERLRDEYESLAIRTARLDPRSADILGVEPIEGARVQAALAPDEALIHYTLTRNELVVFVARQDRFETIQVPVAAEDLTSRIRLFRELSSTRNSPPERGLPAARGLYDLLVAPVVDSDLLEGVSRLVVIPHGVLEQLPFAALRDRSTERFLIEDFVIAYAPSASALSALRDLGPGPTAETRSVLAFAPFPDDLPGTRDEALAASQAGPAGELFLERGATEASVRRALSEASVVHIASHGVLNARNPMFSRVDLARDGANGSTDDGRLEVHEVLGLNVTSPLIVLSGCETAMAEEWSGDPLRPAGVATLAQAFLQAGAGNVIATLWRIDDAASAELVRRFYAATDEDDVAGALARAQRAMIRNAEYAAPYYWAGFVLMGDGRGARLTPGPAPEAQP